MRILILLRGSAGVGKSTFIHEHGWDMYTLCPDKLRLMVRSPQLNIEGGFEISQNNDDIVWDMLFQMLEVRMQNGEFTVIDATNSKTSEINRYKEFADAYRYRIYCIDFTDIPIEECKRRNLERPQYKQVPEFVVDKFYSRFASQKKIPAGVKVIKYDDPELEDKIYFHSIDLTDKYDKIVHIGDIHGCYTALMEYFKDGLDDNTFYIFIGDYIDRGIENVQMIKFLVSIMDRKNVLLLEGNHERWLYSYGNNKPAKSKQFEMITRPELIEGGITEKECRMLYKKLGQCAYYKYENKYVIVTHGGITNYYTDDDNYNNYADGLKRCFSTISTRSMIHGVGEYQDLEAVAETWEKLNVGEPVYQIFGHRNLKSLPMHLSDHVYNLEGKVEFGGYLRIVELSRDGFKEIEIKNDVFKPVIVKNSSFKDIKVADAVLEMRHNNLIVEKKFGPISSFNFSKEAFYDKKWNDQTITARGLYIDTENMTIFCRGYSKFFNINERDEVRLGNLEYKLKFPVYAYVKYNGYLGLISYDYRTDDLFFTTKSNPEGDYAQWFKEIFYSKFSKESIEQMKQLCKDKNVTLVFECIDPVRDPHVIEYQNSSVVLLDAVYNKLKFEKIPYEELVNMPEFKEVYIKSQAYIINTWREFVDWYNTVITENYKYEDKYIEGFVIEDSEGFMVKIKGYYYNFWKFMRNIAQETIKKGYIDKAKLSALTTPAANYFYGWLKTYVADHKDEAIPKDIVTLRRMFLESGYYKNE